MCIFGFDLKNVFALFVATKHLVLVLKSMLAAVKCSEARGVVLLAIYRGKKLETRVSVLDMLPMNSVLSSKQYISSSEGLMLTYQQGKAFVSGS